MDGSTAKRWMVTWTVWSGFEVMDEGSEVFASESDAGEYARQKDADIRAERLGRHCQVWVREVA